MVASILPMALGQIGFLTSVAEELATAVGAGMLLGSFAAGAYGLLANGPRRSAEALALFGGYCGGISAIGLALVDLIVGYAA